MPNVSQAQVDSTPAPPESPPESRVLRLISDRLTQRENPLILDLGPTFGDNIRFFADKAKKLFTFDLFTCLDEANRNRLPAKTAFRFLAYPSRYFDGVLLWNLIDHLNTTDARELARIIREITRPEGVVMILAQDLFKPREYPIAFSIRDESRFHSQSLTELQLQAYYRPTREILDLMDSFVLIKSFISRQGIREYLFLRH
ncbi:MAG: methyltransferase domain-containing protein [Thermodesulfobacteriota bacterium]